MTVNDPFTYNGLYHIKPSVYHYKDSYERLPFQRIKTLFMSDTTVAPIRKTTENFIIMVSSRAIEPCNFLNEFVQLIPFVYIYWFLVGLAVILTLILVIIFICYCHNYCRKSNKSACNEDQQPLPNFYRYRKMKRTVHTNNIYEATTPLPFPSPTRPYPLNTKDYLGNQSLKQDCDTIDSSSMKHMNTSGKKISNQYLNTASDLLAEIKTRLSTRSSGTSIKNDRLCEIPIRCTNMHLNTELTHDSLLLDMN